MRYVFFRRRRIREGIVLPTAAVHHVRCMVHLVGAWKRRGSVVLHHHVVVMMMIVVMMAAWIVWIWFASCRVGIVGSLDTTTQAGHFDSQRRRGERRRPHDGRRRRMWTTAAIQHEVLLLIHIVAGVALLLFAIAGGAVRVSWHHGIDVDVGMLHHGDSTKGHRGQRGRRIRRRDVVVVLSHAFLARVEGLQWRWRRYM